MRVFLSGRLGKDVEFKKVLTRGGKALDLAEWSVATEDLKGKTVWVNCYCFVNSDKHEDFLNDVLKKGVQIAVEATLDHIYEGRLNLRVDKILCIGGCKQCQKKQT